MNTITAEVKETKHKTSISWRLAIVAVIIGALLLGAVVGKIIQINILTYAVAKAATTGTATVGDITFKRLPIQWGDDMVTISIGEAPKEAK